MFDGISCPAKEQVPQDNPFAIGIQAGQHSNLNGVGTSSLRQPTPPSGNEAVYGTITEVNRLLAFFFKLVKQYPSVSVVDKSVILIAFKLPDKINIQNSSYTEENNFRIVMDAGEGVYGEVRICQDNRSEFIFAKKTIQLSGNNKKALSSIRREVEALLWCNSEFIVKLIGIRVYQTDIYMYPEIGIYLEYGGISLKMYLTRIMPDESEMLTIFLHILQAIDYLHKCEHAHTDLHAGNILIDKIYNTDIESVDLKVKLCDLGSVKKFDENLFTPSAGYTAAYFPPTVLKKYCNKEGICVSGRLDTFAVGKILLEAVLGRISSLVTVDEMIDHIGTEESWELFVQSFFPNIHPIYITDKIQCLIVNLMSYNTRIDAAEAIGYIIGLHRNN